MGEILKEYCAPSTYYYPFNWKRGRKGYFVHYRIISHEIGKEIKELAPEVIIVTTPHGQPILIIFIFLLVKS